MEPNYNFENENGNQWDYKNYEFRTIANNLYHKFKEISKKEYDLIIWVGCNLPTKSIIRESMLKSLSEKVLFLERIKKVDNQYTIKL